jgi:hypothetical protein
MHHLSRLLNVAPYLGLPSRAAGVPRPKAKQSRPAAKAKPRTQSKPFVIGPTTFLHLKPAPTLPANPTPRQAEDRARKQATAILAAGARARGETYDSSAGWFDPPRQQTRMVTGAEILAVARRLGHAT